MSKQKQSMGRWGEDAAARYLAERGYEILARNVRTQYGELDLVAKHGELLVFIEVKTRSGNQYGQPEEAITPTKQQHLVDAAESYLQANPQIKADWRVDVIAITQQPGGETDVVHFENALSA